MFRSFRAALVTIIVLSASLPVIVFSALLVDKISQVTSAAALRELDLRVQSVTNALHHQVDLVTFRLLTLAANRDIALATTKSALGVRHFLSYRAMDYVREFLADNPLVASIYLMDREAQVVDAVPAAVAALEPTPVRQELEALLPREFKGTAAPYVFVEFRDRDFLAKTFAAEAQTPQSRAGRALQSDYGLALLVPLILDVTSEVKGALVAIVPFENLAAYATARVDTSAALTFFQGDTPLVTQQQGASDTPVAKTIMSEAPFGVKNAMSGTAIGYRIRISEPYARRFAEVNTTLRKLAISILGAVALLTLFAYLIARWLVSPLQPLGAMVHAYAAGNYGVPLRNVAFREFQHVVTTLGEMRDKIVAQLSELQASRAQLEEYNRTLEQRVEARTQELSETLEQQTTTSEILRVISSSPTDVQPVFDALAQSAVRLCDSFDAVIFRVDADALRLVAHHGPIPYGPVGEFTVPLMKGTVTGRSIIEHRTIHVTDLQTAAEEFPEGAASACQFGHRTTLAVPLLRERAGIGAITLRRTEVRPFTDKQIDLLKTFADQAVIAIENVHLFQELQARTSDLARSVQDLTVLSEVSQAVSATLDLQEVLTTIVTQAVQLTKTDGGTIYEFDAAEQVFVPRASYGMSSEFVDVLRQSCLRIGDESIVGRASARRTPLQIPDLLNEPNYPLLFVQQAGFRAVLAVPLFREDRPIGALAVLRRATGAFPKETVDLLQTFAAQSTLAIQNARLFQEIDDKSRQLGIANQRLQELDQLKSDFLSTVSHELRTPLTSVLGFARIIAKRYEESLLPYLDQSQARVRRDAQRITENLQIIIDEGERLTRLINDVLDLSKIESGKVEWQMQEVSLHEVVQRAVNATSSLARDKGLDVQVVSHTEEGQVYGDVDRLTQVVTNLLGNAIKFTNEGSVTCVLERHADVITVKVKDTGVGIAPEDIDKVFEKFRQVGDTLTDKPKGTGLGLTICKEIIAHHGGRIWVESVLGIGSTFIFTLPAMPAQVVPAPEIPLLSQVKQHVATTLSKGTEDTRRILIVDDEKHIRTLLRQELEGAGYHVLEAQDGHAALQLATTAHPHLIILDILMPGLDGFQVATLLKQDATTASIPIMILSIVEDKERGYRLGVDSYLTKPVDSDQLLATVASLVAREPTRPTTRKKILVIEDDAGIVRAIEQVLSAYEVTVVQSGSEGMRLAQQERPDVIILDGSLPEAGEIVKTLRSLTETRESQLLVLTDPFKAEIATILGTLHGDERAPARKTAG